MTPGDRLKELVHEWDIPNEDCFCLIHVTKMNDWGDHCLNCKKIITLWLVGSARKIYPRVPSLLAYWYASYLVSKACRKNKN